MRSGRSTARLRSARSCGNSGCAPGCSKSVRRSSQTRDQIRDRVLMPVGASVRRAECRLTWRVHLFRSCRHGLLYPTGPAPASQGHSVTENAGPPPGFGRRFRLGDLACAGKCQGASRFGSSVPRVQHGTGWALNQWPAGSEEMSRHLEHALSKIDTDQERAFQPGLRTARPSCLKWTQTADGAHGQRARWIGPWARRRFSAHRCRWSGRRGRSECS